MLRIAAAAVVAAHGLIHLIGFVVPWGIAAVEGFPYRTAVLGGAVDLGDDGGAALGIVWLACAIGFVDRRDSGSGDARRGRFRSRRPSRSSSIAVCALGLPETSAGIVVDLAILVAAAWVALARRQAGSPALEPVR